MYATKHDLSLGEAKLDFEALLKTSEIAFGLAVEAIRHDLSVIEDQLEKDGVASAVYLASLQRHAKEAAVAGETHAALVGAKTRSNIFIVGDVLTTSSQK